MTWPNPNEKFPIPAYKGLGFLKNFIQDPNIIVGDYTYYDDPEGVENFEKNIIKHAIEKYGSTRKAAKAIGISQTQLVRKKNKYNI